ncbi:MAG: hydroxyacid dehydrogenase [Patescibacteria group bacterium]|nr:hydroxyacid dehydrogenase [Patescibacteria group bacterium]
MKIAFFETKPWEAEYLKARLPGFDLEFYGDEQKAASSDAEILCNFIGFRVNAEVLGHFPKLKYVTTRSTGYDHIDVETCAKKKILVSNVPTYGENTVAEFTFALLLALSRKIYPSVKRVREEAWFSCDDLQGFDLMGKTIGVIGTGHIGTYAIKIAAGFGMHVIAYDPYPKPELAKVYNFEYVSLEELLTQSDVISLHVPYMPATHHILSRKNLNLVKPGAVLINTARGGLVETAALVEALKSGRLAGAAMDVLEEEGFIKEEAEMLLSGHPNEEQLKTVLADHELMHMPNVLITPHNAFNTKEALTRILDTTVSNIQGFAKSSPINLVKA